MVLIELEPESSSSSKSTSIVRADDGSAAGRDDDSAAGRDADEGKDAFDSDSDSKEEKNHLEEQQGNEELRVSRATANEILKMRKYEDTIKECTKALELNPEYLKALIRRGEAHEKVQHFDEAIAAPAFSLSISLRYGSNIEIGSRKFGM